MIVRYTFSWHKRIIWNSHRSANNNIMTSKHNNNNIRFRLLPVYASRLSEDTEKKRRCEAFFRCEWWSMIRIHIPAFCAPQIYWHSFAVVCFAFIRWNGEKREWDVRARGASHPPHQISSKLLMLKQNSVEGDDDDGEETLTLPLVRCCAILACRASALTQRREFFRRFYSLFLCIRLCAFTWIPRVRSSGPMFKNCFWVSNSVFFHLLFAKASRFIYFFRVGICARNAFTRWALLGA